MSTENPKTIRVDLTAQELQDAIRALKARANTLRMHAAHRPARQDDWDESTRLLSLVNYLEARA